MNNFGGKVNFIWKIAEILRGPYKAERYGDVILPMAVLRRSDCLLEQTEVNVLEKAPRRGSFEVCCKRCCSIN